ncbi:MAG: hypothetical protein G3M78_09835 [Candidatus Nitrohelix vancouverensis]|uniref:Uncharacterized protein n=1 Tax=Candidatus Nitrohelix vancouverensis TaxID=2705534 RepID=A0A7T0G3Q8_9BACT|nr:MAG: hypothetical protein G3M78_09835 [Candidatus Nitrohelix vancouverensis]
MMKRSLVLLVVLVSVCFAGSAFAGSLNPGDSTSCNDANSITLENTGSGSAADHHMANAVIWKSSNFTTIPLTLGTGADDHGLEGERGVGMANKQSKGRSKVTFTRQENFSRGDSLGDISGEVRITNTGTAAISVNCG